jgi:hypothetical protein
METTAYTFSELDIEAALLPPRQVLALFNWLFMSASNAAYAFNGLSAFSTAAAGAAQTIAVSQS